MYSAERIRETIARALPGAEIRVTDTTGTGDHFDALVIWKGFTGKSLLEQHRMVLAPLGEDLKEAIHALKIKTQTA